MGVGAQSIAVVSTTQRLPVSTNPAEIVLGMVAPSDEQLGYLVAARRTHVARVANDLPESSRGPFLGSHLPLQFADFRDAVRNRDKWRREAKRTGELSDTQLTWSLDAFLNAPRNVDRYTSDRQGWLNYLVDHTPQLADRIASMANPGVFPEAVRQMHTLITAASGWGKSELMKALVHHYLVHPTAAVVVLDPHGDMAAQIARFPELRDSGRLLYVEPNLRRGFTVGLNPLDGRGLDEDSVPLFAAQVATCLGEIVADLTPNMQTVARNCVRVLLEEPGATLFDLVKLLAPRRRKRDENEPDDPRRMALIAKGRRHPDFTVAEFFRADIEAESFDSSKAALRNRVLSLLSIQSFQAMTCGPATVHLATALEQRKVILVNLGPLGSEGGAAMGRLVLSLVAAIGRRREGTPMHSRVPCHVFVDEASTMVSPAMGRILAELRKYGIHLTLAQQVGGVGFDEDGRKVLATNTACKLVGSNSRADLKAVFGDEKMEDVERLTTGQFWVRWGRDMPPTRLQVRDDLANGAHAVSDAEWEAMTAEMVASFYRPAKAVQNAAQAASGAPSAAAPPASAPQPPPVPETPRLVLPLE